MAVKKLILDFSDLKDAELAPKAENIVTSITGNIAFPDPSPSMVAMQQSIDFYSAALAKVVNNGTKADTIIKDDKRKILEGELVQLGTYVMGKAAGDGAVLASSGYDLWKQKEKIGPLDKAENLKVQPGANKGSVDLSVNKIANADFYEFQYSEFPLNGAGWQTRTSQKTKITIDSLVSGKQYTFRVAGAGSDLSRNWSDEINSYVL